MHTLRSRNDKSDKRRGTQTPRRSSLPPTFSSIHSNDHPSSPPSEAPAETVSIGIKNDRNDKPRRRTKKPRHSARPPTSSSIHGNDHPPPLLPAAAASETRGSPPTKSPVHPQQRSGSKDTAPSPRGAENARQRSAFLHSPDGYNHSKVLWTSPVATATHTLPSWLKDMSQSKSLPTCPFLSNLSQAIPKPFANAVVPPLPVIGDPINFLTFYELNAQLSSSPDDDLPHKSNARHFRNAYTSEFRTLAFNGDLELKFRSNPIITRLFGPNSRLIGQFLSSDWLSNETWQELAMFYRLDEYVGWFPKSLRDGDDVDNSNKFWADVWEAWWACCFSEREIWGDDVDDLVSCLRRLIELKYWTLVKKYSTNLGIDRESSIHHRMNIDQNEQVHTEEVWTTNADIRQCVGSVLKDKNKEFLGYLGILGSDILSYSEEIDIAISSALFYAKHGYKGIFSKDFSTKVI